MSFSKRIQVLLFDIPNCPFYYSPLPLPCRLNGVSCSGSPVQVCVPTWHLFTLPDSASYLTHRQSLLSTLYSLTASFFLVPVSPPPSKRATKLTQPTAMTRAYQYLTLPSLLTPRYTCYTAAASKTAHPHLPTEPRKKERERS